MVERADDGDRDQRERCTTRVPGAAATRAVRAGRSTRLSHGPSFPCRRLATRTASARSRPIAARISAPTAARCQNGLMPSTGSAAADRGEQHRAERGAVDRAAAAEDGHPADHDRGDHVELDAEPGVGVEGAEPGRVAARRPDRPARRWRRTRRRPAGRPGCRTAGPRPGRSRSRTAPGRCGRSAGSSRRRPATTTTANSASTGTPSTVAVPMPQEAGRHVGGVDLPAGGPRVVDAPEHVQRAERDHQRRHPGRGDQAAVDRAAARAPERHADERATTGIGSAGRGHEQAAGRERGQARGPSRPRGRRCG